MTYGNTFASHHRRGSDQDGFRRRTETAPASPTPRLTRTQGVRGPYASRHRTQGRKAFLARGLAALVLVAALAGAAWYAVSTLSSLASGSSTGGRTSADSPQSTPKSEWRLGEVPALYQRDPAWSQERYAEDAFAESGCGPTCLAMVYVALTGKNDLTPADAGALSERLGCASVDGTAWAFMTEGAAQLGLLAEEVPADELSVRRALIGGSPVICSLGPGDFTSTGHFIVLTGIDAQGRLIVRDPNSPERTAQSWDFDRVFSQCRNLWAYTAA